MHLYILLSNPHSGELKVTDSTYQAPIPLVRALIRDVVKSEESEPAPHHSCDPLPHLFPAGITLSLYQAGGCSHSFIYSTNTQQMLFYPSHGPSLWGHSDK